MNGNKVLVIGGSGFIGQNIMHYFSCNGTSRTGRQGLIKLDIRDGTQVKKVLESYEPAVVINSAGITNVDYCEAHTEEANIINGYCVKSIADEVENIGATFVQLSTDYVYSGETGNYAEDDETVPVNAYGKSKLMGEQFLEDRKCIILRISTPYGDNRMKVKDTFLDFLLSNLGSGRTIRVVKDQFTTPTFALDIPLALEVLIDKHASGIFNLGSKECISRYEFSLLVAKIFSMNSSLIVSSITAKMNFIARRPLRTCMDVSKILKYVEIKDTETNLRHLKSNIIQFHD